MELIYIYKLIGENNLFGDIAEQTLKNRGIKDIERFLNPSKDDEIHYSNLKNMSKAVKMFEKHKGDTSEFAVIVDSDAD